jgi:vancomycin resistance protein VanW
VAPLLARLSEAPRWRQLLRRLRRQQLAASRLLRWPLEAEYAPRYGGERPPHCLAKVRAPMSRAGGHPTLERGKRRNVALAATAIDGLAVGPGAPFSFWRVVGPVSQGRGYVAGMELQAGCAVPAIGGGICLLSNALYQLAALAGWQILERHGHTAAVADVLALDATVAFPHVDLRFAAPRPALLSAEVRGDVLVVAAWSAEPPVAAVRLERTAHEVAEASGQVRVTVARVVGDRREVLSHELRRQLPHDRPTCLSCDQIDCRTGERLRRAAGVSRDGA